MRGEEEEKEEKRERVREVEMIANAYQSLEQVMNCSL